MDKLHKAIMLSKLSKTGARFESYSMAVRICEAHGRPIGDTSGPPPQATTLVGVCGDGVPTGRVGPSHSICRGVRAREGTGPHGACATPSELVA